ncbi:hypothetical protein H6F51_23185 [Cyanobacteria bacterium FACHB-DQ100]|nr:hypothetical protein [Cyanobacteria bacterium FACHB-DQ100]
MNSIVRSTIVAQIGATIAIAASSVDVAPAHALAINGASSGISNPAQTIDFNDLTVANGTAITNQYSSSGVTFSNLFAFGGGFPNISGRSLANFSSGSPLNPFSIRFSTPQTGASFAMVTNSGTSTITALLNGQLVETFTANTNTTSSNNFYGFTASGFDEIQIVASNVNGAAAIDNLQFDIATPVPFGFTPLPGLAVSALLCGVNRLRKRFAKEQIEG